MKFIKKIIVPVVLIGLSAGFVSYLYISKKDSVKDEWSPSGSEPTPILIFEAKWGNGETDLGFHKASGQEGDTFNLGFESFFVKGDKVFIADPVKQQISLFQNNKLVKAYEYPMREDEGLVVIDEYIFIMDPLGYLRKINISTGKLEQAKKVIKEENISHFAYTIYDVDDLVAIFDYGLRETINCVSTKDLSDTDCPFRNIKGKPGIYNFNLPNGNYVSMEKYENFWLHNEKGRKIGIVRGAFGTDYLYTLKSFQISLGGIYFVTHSNDGAKIYFKKWQK